MKKLRFLVPVFSFGLILAFALTVQYGSGDESFFSVSQVYSTSSKSFSAVSTKVNVGRLSFIMPTAFFQLLAFFMIVGVFICFYVLVLKRNKNNLRLEEESNEDI